MLILSAGMMRSGSTWQFNAIRILLKRYSRMKFEGCVYKRGLKLDEGCLLVKCHPFVPQLAQTADLVFTCHRDIRDACASLIRFHPNRVEPAQVKIAKEFENYNKWKAIAEFDMRYEDMIDDPLAQLEQIAAFLPVSGVNVEKVMLELCSVRPPASRAGMREDPLTLLWANHITNGRPGSYLETLPMSVLDQLESRFGNWLSQNGYPLSKSTSQ